MTVVTSKVCVVGDFAVGKTSVVERFVHNQFSDKYLTTVGVKVDTKEIEIAELDVSHKLILWDVAGADRFGETEFAYLRGASGHIFVADGTRPMTLKAVREMRQQINSRFGTAPCVLLVNKNDLVSEWDVSDEKLALLGEDFCQVYSTSAKTGDAVETAMTELSKLIIDNDLKSR